MKHLLAIFTLISLVGCGSKEADPNSPKSPVTILDQEMVRRSDVHDVINFFMFGNDPPTPFEAPPVAVWKSEQPPSFVYVENMPTSGLFTDQESKDFVDRANKKIEELSSSFAQTVESHRNFQEEKNLKEDPPTDDKTIWLVIKYTRYGKGLRGPYSIVVRPSNSVGATSSFIPIGPSKDLIEEAYTRAAREKGELVLLPDDLKYRLDYAESARVF
ncbi:MAG: hypothetical protein P8L85_18780 [Rubripirellula sp.]|nr:hypothetical protein [Rubripirellula sp.]